MLSDEELLNKAERVMKGIHFYHIPVTLNWLRRARSLAKERETRVTLGCHMALLVMELGRDDDGYRNTGAGL